jgi:20S proteasome alpha/beta subunit
MTLISAFRCSTGGVLLCADQEETDWYSKRSVGKIFNILLQQANFFIAGAGHSAIIANTFSRLEDALKNAERTGVDIFQEHQRIIRNVLYLVHEEFIWGQHNEEGRRIWFIFAVAFRSPHSVPIVYGTTEDILFPEQLCICAGAGKSLADYFCSRLYLPSIAPHQAVFLASFVFREVSQSVSGVGLGTDMIFMEHENLRFHNIAAAKVKELEGIVPSVTDAIVKAWNQEIKVPDWLKNEFE